MDIHIYPNHFGKILQREKVLFYNVVFFFFNNCHKDKNKNKPIKSEFNQLIETGFQIKNDFSLNF